MTPLFTIPVHDIDAGGLVRSFELPLPWLALVLGDTEVSAETVGHADVRLGRLGNDVIVRGKVTGTLSQPCARCLRPTISAVEGELSLMLRPARSEGPAARHTHGGGGGGGGKDAKDAGKRGGGKETARSNGAGRHARDEEEEHELTAEEADEDTYDGELVVLDDFLREALLLEVPSFPLCSEDCPGIRPPSRTAPPRREGIDPRLSPLRALKTKLMLASAPEGGEGAPLPDGEDAPSGAALRAAEPAPERTGKPARPRIHAHRSAGSISGAKGGSKKSRAKNSPPKKAK